MALISSQYGISRNFSPFTFQEGYAIYIVTGPIPDCQADQILRLAPAVQNERPKLLGEVGSSGQGRGSSGQSGQPTSGQNAEEALMQSARGLAMVNQPAGAEFGGRYYIEMIESSSVNAPMFHSVSLLMSFFFRRPLLTNTI